MKDWLIRAKKGLQAQRRHSRWKKLVGVMAMVVTFGITYAMILPAITMEREYVCGITEHVHTEECYAQQQVLSCGLQEDDTHMHDESCLETEQVLSCGLEEHTHTEICYQDIEPQPEETYPADTPDVPEPTETSDVPEPADAPEVNEPEIALTTDVVFFDAASTAETVVYDLVPAAEDEDTGGNESSNDNGFQLGDTEIKKLVVFYKNDENKWVEITEETEVSGDAELRLEVKFSVEKTEVEANGYRIVYNVPDFLRIQEADGLKIQDSNNEPIGTIAVEQQKFILVLDKDWVEKQSEDIQGTFYMESKLNLSYIKDHPDSSSLTIGNLTINVTDVEDWVARYNILEVEKKLMDASDNLQVEHTDDGDYLTYQLTAAAGPDGVENARIIDDFTAGKSYVAEYVGVTMSAVSTDSASLAGVVTEEHPEGTEAGTVYYGDASTQPVPTPDGSGAMVWQIGKMQPNEVRTLTYKVKLVDGYSAKLQSKNITNQADAYSGDYKRDETSAIFTPKGKATMSKTSEINLDSDGIGGSITYTIWVKAQSDNNFILDDVKLYDFYVKYGSNNSVQAMPGYVTMPQAKDFQLLDASGKVLSIEELNPEKDAGNPVINTEDKSFVCYVGPLKPGEERTLQYTIQLKDAAFLTDDYNEEDGTLRLCNRARVFPGKEEHKVTGGNSLEGYTITDTLNHYTWCTKAVGKETLSADTVFEINSGDEIFTLQNGKLEPETSEVSEFTVQAGSVRYEVKINPSGVLNVNSVTMEDALGAFLRYAGYVRIVAFQKPSGANQYMTVDYTGESVKTVWVDINGKSQFTFCPKDLGFDEDESYAYMLTYFASPYGIEEGNLQTVDNAFILTGQVGPNGIYTLSGIEVSASATVFGTSRFNAEKRAWYYSRPAADADENWSKGELYWYIEISGTAIPKGTSLQDQPDTNHKIKEDSLVGVFYGRLPADAADAAALETLTHLEAGRDYTAEQDLNRNNLTLTFLEEYPLEEGNSVYIVVKTSPTTLPGKLGFASYENGLYLRNNEGEYIENQTPVSQTIAGDDGISKEAKLAFTCDSEGNKTKLWATGWHDITDEYLDMEQIETPGIYTEWLVTVNYHGSLAGDYLVEDQLPDGMIPVYVRGYFIANSEVTSPDIGEYENSLWEKHTNTNRRSATKTTTWYYNPDTGQVQWAVNGLQSAPVAEGNQDNTQTAQYQIVCRVTDKDVLLGGQAKSIQNYVTLTDSNENPVGDDFDTIELEKRTPLDKQGVADGSINDSNRYPFTVTLNPEGIDLMPDSDTIRLVDELSDSLTLDPSSIRVVKLGGTQDAQTEEELSIEQYKVELDGQIMTITLPDDLPLRITYAAIINAAPGTPVDISNNAHWEGYASSDDTVVENKNFEYSVGAVLTGEKASLQLVKVDANDINQKLRGATFTVQEVTVDRTNPQNPVLGEAVEPIHTGTTDENGTVVFPEASESWMKYNTVYQLVETKAPDGYVLDKTPYYFVLAVKQDDDTYPTFPEGVNVRYGVSRFQYTAFNQKGRILVDKSFVGGDDSEIAVQGTYTFGLFQENPDVPAEASPVQRLAMTFESGKAPSYFRDGVKATTPTFKNLELNQTYYIRELDADGRPIANGGMAWLGNYCFEVTYTNADGMQPKSNSDETGTVSVRNKQILTYELPESGGTGTMIYEMLGSALMLGAGLGYFKMSETRKTCLGSSVKKHIADNICRGKRKRMKANMKKLIGTLTIIALAVICCPMMAFAAEEAAEYVPSMYATFWALIPPVVAIVLALITKEVYSSLFIGILVGGLFYSGFSFEGTINHIFQEGFIGVLSDSYNVGILVFLVILGTMVCLMNKAGGSAAFGRWASVHIKSRVGAQLATVVLGCLIFIDDYFNCLTVGSVMRPVTDKHKISRAKLAYLIDATAAPVCIIAPISSWAAAVTGFVEGADGFSLFIRAIPYNFYALLTIVMMITLAVAKIEYGPMRLHEENAVKGDLYTTPDRPYANAEEDDTANPKGRVIDLVIPIICLIVCCIIGMIYTGGFFEGTGFIEAFSNCDASVGLAYGSFFGLVITIILYMVRRVLSFKECMECLPDGFKAMVPAILILTMAWSLKSMTDSLGAAEFVAELVKSSAQGFISFLPAIIFLVGCFLAFATGTSWGTFGILIPIVVDAFAGNETMMIIAISACMAGAVCGDHCSPISDTTIMASAGAQSNHINHVNTQLPYAITAAAVSCVTYIVAGFVKTAWIALPVGIVLMLGTLFVIRRMTGALKE